MLNFPSCAKYCCNLSAKCMAVQIGGVHSVQFFVLAFAFVLGRQRLWVYVPMLHFPKLQEPLMITFMIRFIMFPF